MRMRRLDFYLLFTFTVLVGTGFYQDVWAQPRAGIRVGNRVLSRGDTIDICVGGSILYINQVSGAVNQIRWRFNNGTPTNFTGFGPPPILYNSGGIDTTWQVVTDGTRRDSTFIFVRVNTQKPTVSFTFNPNGECASTPIQFTNNTTGGNNIRYVWNFGDGSPPVKQINPIRIFETDPAGPLIQTFQVKLIATNDGNCTDSITSGVMVRRTPDPSLDRGDPGIEFLPNFNGVPTFRRCENTPSYEFAFQNATTTPSQIVRYRIAWGDGTPDTVFNSWPVGPMNPIRHRFPRGNTIMTLTVSGSDGCDGIRNFNVFLGTTPAGGFASRGNTSVCAPNALNFIINETENNAPGTLYRVTVNDGTSPQVFLHPPPAEVTHVFEKTSCGNTSSNGINSFNNSYGAILDVQNPCGTTSVSVIPIYVSGKPKARFLSTPSNDICVNNTITFTDDNIYGGKITPIGGTDASCENTGRMVWSISPSIGYTITAGTTGSINGNPADGFFWTTGSSNLIVRFTQTGEYTVKIYAANDLCGVDSFENVICVRNPPTASFSMDKKYGCAPMQVEFSNSSPIGLCGGETYQWNIRYLDPLSCGSTRNFTFMNGTNAQSRNPNIQFNTPGTYIIDLNVFAVASGCISATFSDTFFAVARPRVDLGTISVLCAGNNLNPVATVSNCYGPGNPTWLWTFSGGTPNISNLQSPGPITYGTNGTYPVTLAVTNDCGTTTVTRNLIVGPRPQANAGPDIEVCSGQAISLGVSPAAGVSYNWTPATGLNNTTVSNPILTYNYAGTSSDTTVLYEVRAFTGPDCFTTDTVLVKVRRSPALTITPDMTSICLGGSATLTASGADTYSWSPVAGLSQSNIPQVTASPGVTTTYTVTGTLLNGCTVSRPVTVSVISRPVVSAGPDTLACNNAPDVVLPGSPTGGRWSGSPFVTATGIFNPRIAGNGIFKLYYEFFANGCEGIDSMLVTVQDPPFANAGRDTLLCADGSTYRLTGTPAGGSWSGSPFVTTSGNFSATTPGTYSLVYSRGSGSCIGYDTVVVSVVQSVANNTISATQGVCGGQIPAPLVGSNAIAGGLPLQYQWQISSDSLAWSDIPGAIMQNLPIPIPTGTIYYRRLASTSVCTAGSPSNVVRIFIHPNAKADINPVKTVGCAPFAITPAVVNLTSYPDRNSTYRWLANNNPIGTGETFPGFTILSPDDSVVITLITLSMFGCVHDTTSVLFKTISNPVPSFTLSDTVGCGPLSITITNTTPRPERYTFLWETGTGIKISGPNPGTILFPINPNLGDTIYVVRLQATGGCDTFAVTKPIRVRAKPRTLFTPDKAEGCSPFRVTLNNNSAGSNANFRWDFGDGSPQQSAGFNSVTHTYFTGKLDTFTVRLFGTNDCGTDTARFNLVVNPNRIKLDFAVNGNELNGCAPHTVRFINNTTGANLFRWNFGDGSPVLTTNRGFDTLVHVFRDSGTYAVTLFATNGCSDTITTESIRVTQKPKVEFVLSPATICLGSPFSLQNNSEDGLAWNWSFGDGTTSTLRTPQKMYTAAGTYRIVLKGSRQFSQGFSCSDSSVAFLKVVAPTGDWRYRGGYYCEGQPVGFDVTNTTATRFKFIFGNGDSLVTSNPSIRYTYPQPGVYLPRVVLELQGCTLIIQGVDSIRVDRIRPGFTVSNQQFCGFTQYDFSDTTTSFFGLSQRSWFFSNGNTSAQMNSRQTYSIPGSYSIRLRITGISGCTDSMVQTLQIPVQPIPAVAIAGDTSACTGQEARFEATDITGSATAYTWQVQGGNTQTGSRAGITWPLPGTFRLGVVARTPFGCADTAFQNVRVNPSPAVVAGNDITLCRGQSTRLSASGATIWQWSPVQGLSCNDCASPIANPNLTTLYTIRGTNGFGCSRTDSLLVSVAQPFRISVSQNDTICASLNERAPLLAQGAFRYVWSPASGLNGSAIPNPVATPAATTNYRVIGFDAENCFTDTAFVTVGVGYNPTVDIPAGRLVVAGTQVLLQANLSGGPFRRLLWTPDKDLSCNNCPAPLATIQDNIRYQLEAETIYGCRASDAAVFTVECKPDQVFVPNAFSPDGDGVNDILMVRGIGVARVKSFRIFNRFGQVVFEKQNFAANDPNAGWNGHVNGVPSTPDVYIYTAEVLCTSGQTVFTYKGNVTLFR